MFDSISLTNGAFVISTITTMATITTYIFVPALAGNKVYHNYLRESRNSIFLILAIMIVMAFNRIPAPFFLYLGIMAAVVGMLNSLRLLEVLRLKYKSIKCERALSEKIKQMKVKIMEKEWQSDLSDAALEMFSELESIGDYREGSTFKIFIVGKVAPAIVCFIVENLAFYMVISVFLSVLRNYY